MAGNANAIKMGRAFVQLFVEDNAAYRQLDKFGNKFKAWGGTLQKLGGTLGAAGSALLAPMLASLKEVIGRANDLQLLTDRIGAPVSVLSALQGGFERAGVSAEAFQSQIEGFQLAVQEAANANGYLAEDMKALGRGADLAQLGVKGLMYRLAEYVQRSGKGNQTLALQRAGFSKELLPYFERGRAGIDELSKNGGPGALTDEQGRQSVAVTNAMRAAWHDFKDTVRQVGLSLLPTAAGLAEMKAQFKAGLTAVRDWIKENRGVVVATAAVGVGLFAAGVAVAALGTAFVGVGTVMLGTLAALKASFALAFSPLALGAAGLVALAGGAIYLMAQTDRGKAAVADLGEGFTSLAGRAKETFGGITAAINAGEWTTAWQIGLAGLKAEWANFNFYFQLGWNATKEVFVDGWKDAVAGFKVLFIDLGAFIGKCVQAWLNQMAAIATAVDPLGARGAVGRNVGRAIRGLGDSLPTDAQTADARNAVMGERAREQGEANASRGAAAREAFNARNDARRELADLIRKNMGGGGLGDMLAGIAGGIGDSLRSGVGQINGPARLSDAVKGVTGGGNGAAISQQLAYGDTIPQRQLDAAEQARDILAENLPSAARDLNIIAGRGRVS